MVSLDLDLSKVVEKITPDSEEQDMLKKLETSDDIIHIPSSDFSTHLAGQSDTSSFLKLNHAHKVPHNCIALVFGIIVNLF